jgi:signal transduction histidine kinase/CheY-like chemotaxis protein
MALKIFFGGLDQRVRRILNRYLPENLTARYILALCLIASLSFAGQIVTQLSLTSLQDSQRFIRAFDREIPDLEEARKMALAVQFSSNRNEMLHRVEGISSLHRHLLETISEFADPPSLDSATTPWVNLHLELSKIAELSEKMRSMLTPQQERQYVKQLPRLMPIASEILEAIARCQKNVNDMNLLLERSLERKVHQFREIEFSLFLATLLVLFFEAFYVFRPAVERLYEALATRSAFLSRMSHELRNPMNSIIGMANLLSQTPVSEHQANYLSVLKRSGSGLLDMLNSLLDFASIETGNLKLERVSFSLLDVLERCIDLGMAASESNRNGLFLDLSSDVPLKVLGDSVRLQQIISNLIGNAVKFTHDGNVILTVTRAGAGKITFAISDTGIGIEEKTIDKIFDPFVQENSSIRRRFGGSGLGLSISKDIIGKMGGRLQVESKKNEGSRFSFTLPLQGDPGTDLKAQIQNLKIPEFLAFVSVHDDLLYKILESVVGSAGGTSVRISGISELQKKTLVNEKGLPSLLLIDGENLETGDEAQITDLPHTLLFVRGSAPSTEIESWTRRFPGNLVFKPIRPVQLALAIRGALTNEPGTKAQAPLTSSRPSLSAREVALNILVADDASENQALIRGYFESLPHRLTFAKNGQEAIDAFIRDSRFDLVLMDLEMPEVDGYTATAKIREWEQKNFRSTTPIIVISAYQRNERAPVPGATRQLTKPLSGDDLFDAIGEVVKQSADVRRKSNVAALEQKLKGLGPKYLEDRRTDLAGAVKAFVHKDFAPIQSFGHRIKGNALTYGFAKLGELGKELEAAAIAKDSEQIQAALNKIDEFLKQQEPVTAT